MDLISTIDQESCMKYVVVRWKNLENGSPFSNTELFRFLMSIDYDVSDSIFHLYTTDSESAILLKLANEKDAMEMCMNSKLIDSGFFVNRLIGLNGIRLRDTKEILKTLSTDREFTDNDLMETLIRLICLEVPEREKIAEEELKIIENGISELVKNAVFTIFGSYNSKVRRNGFSDIVSSGYHRVQRVVCFQDLAVSSTPSDRIDVRPVDMIIENPKCLLETPLSHAEFYSYPPEEVIRAIYKCFLDNEVFQNRFKMRAHLVETPIVMLDSTKVPEMKIGYDISVNNQISVEKAQILNDFIEADMSDGNKMRSVAMFIVHWAKTNKLLGGAYADEKLVVKFKFNSYIIIHLIIHFVQIALNKLILDTRKNPEDRVDRYNFDGVFSDYMNFFKQFCEYYLNFDYENMGIFGFKLIKKSELAEAENVKESPWMMVDPLHTTHNISYHVVPEGIKHFRSLLETSLEKMKNPKFRMVDLLA
ncbi:hypothetical protein B9Z55_013727 [Caenorhabditis nigoni]|uniref:PAP-associated domain-containing protein n=1 Tax=Caenorhabditis nigoni TaxID=1611254 RepID=A0A2G5U3J1_9PELO|nr:hypothetical protein B9Z55_013727 [Caenorhabditis nigoni]